MTDFSYSTTESEIDIGNDVEELMLKIQKLNSENENLSKSLREKEHIFSQKESEFHMVVEKLRNTNQSLNELLNTYKLVKPTGTQDEIQELTTRMSELESKLFLSEQSEQNLKRQNQSLNMEISNLKMDISKLNLSAKNSDSPNFPKQSTDLDNLDQLDEETKIFINDLMSELEDLKREKNEVSENALNILTEKELEIMELREKFDELKQSHQEEINLLVSQCQELKANLEEKELGLTSNDNNDQASFNSDEARMLLERYKELQDEFDDFKREVVDREKVLIYENEKLKRELRLITETESSYKSNIQDLESEISKLRNEISNSEYERFQIEKEIQEDKHDNKQFFIMEIENLQNQIRHLEENKEKTEIKYKEKIQRMDNDLKELDSVCANLRKQILESEKEVTNLKLNLNKNIKEVQEKSKVEISVKEKENLQLKQRIETLAKECETLRKEYEIIKKNSEKTKNEYKDLNDTLKKIKENNENELRKWEERYYTLEKKLENEKSNLLEQNKELQLKLNNLKLSHSECVQTSSISNDNENHTGHSQQQQLFTQSSLSDIMNNFEQSEQENSSHFKISSLNDEISKLNSQISELNNKIKHLENRRNETESLSTILSKENLKLKSDVKELKEMYEKQLSDLQSKALQMSNELQTTRRRTTNKNSIKGEFCLNPKQLQMLAELENTISRLTGENKFQSSQIEILNKEIENLKIIRENDIKYLKEELNSTEQQAINAKVSLATFAFEKETEIIKCKNIIKKYQIKLGIPMNTQKNQGKNNLTKSNTTKK